MLIRIETRAGHGAGVPTDKVIANYSDNWAFLFENLGMESPEGSGRQSWVESRIVVGLASRTRSF